MDFSKKCKAEAVTGLTALKMCTVTSTIGFVRGLILSTQWNHEGQKDNLFLKLCKVGR